MENNTKIKILSQEDDQLSLDSSNNGDMITKDAIKLLHIFPQEIWIPILEEATDDVKENLCNACPYFRHLLFDERTHFLIPKVWNILCVKYHQRRLPLSEKVPKRYCGSDPLPEILKCRLICHKWCDAIDKFYENIPQILQEDKQLLLSNRDQLLKQFIYGSRRRTGTVTSHFDRTHETSNRNPFLGRRLNIEFGKRGENFLDDVLIPLRKYGHHIWHSNITVYPYYLSWTVFYTMLRSVLEELPNLKTLTIDRYNPSTSRCPLNNVRVGDVLLLICEINLNPLPTINSLQSIKTPGLLTPIFKEIIERNWHITILDAYQLQVHHEGNDLLDILLPNLKMFSISGMNEQMFGNFENAQLFPNLEELKLELVSGLEWSRVFRVLEQKCGNTAKKLEIRLPPRKGVFDEIAILEESASLRLNLPWVKNLILDLPRNACLDFILPMKESLETLDVTQFFYGIDRKRKSDLSLKYEQQKVNFVGWKSDLNASNVWVMFPKLKWIIHRERAQSIQKSWTRIEWEQELKLKSKAV